MLICLAKESCLNSLMDVLIPRSLGRSMQDPSRAFGILAYFFLILRSFHLHLASGAPSQWRHYGGVTPFRADGSQRRARGQTERQTSGPGGAPPGIHSPRGSFHLAPSSPPRRSPGQPPKCDWTFETNWKECNTLVLMAVNV